MALPDPSEVGRWIFVAGAAGFALWQQRAAEKAKEKTRHVEEKLAIASSDDLGVKNKELAEAYKTKAEEWQATWKKEHEESQVYRKTVHDQRQIQQAEHLKLVEENARLASRTDLSPILDHIKQQQQANSEITQALTQLTNVIKQLAERIPPFP